VLFGVITMTFFYRPILEAVEIIARCGFDCVEIWADHAWDERDGASSAELKAALAKHNLKSTVHCPIMDISITSPNRGIREESIRQTLRSIDLAKELGSRLIVIHPGSKFSRLERNDAHWNYQVDSMGRILGYAREQGVLAAVENMDSDKEVVSVKDWGDLERLFSDVGSIEQWVTLDVTHLRDTDRILSFIAGAGSRIAHVHLSDATAEQMHLRLGQGSLDLPRIVTALRDAGYRGVWSLECFIPDNNEEKLREELAKAQALFS